MRFHHINDTVHGLIELTNYEKRILGTAGFNRLHDVYQNSTVYLTFPSNRTKRFEHSLGTMKLASDMFISAIKNSDSDTLHAFFEIYSEAIDQIVLNNLKEEPELRGNKLSKPNQSIHGLQKPAFNTPLKLLIPTNVNENYHACFIVLLEAIRIAALLHDIGHPPYSHIVESALKNVYQESLQDSLFRSAYCKKFNNYFSENKQLHEEMGLEISLSILRDVIPDKDSPIQINDAEKQFRLIVRECVSCIYKNIIPFNFLHHIIAGTLDADRLDFVTRDPMASGFNNGTIDYSRIISNMRVVVEKELPDMVDNLDPLSNIQTKRLQQWDSKVLATICRFGQQESPCYDIKERVAEDYIKFCMPEKCLNSVEDFLSRRFDLYRNIVAHHHVVKTDYYLEQSVKLLIEEYLDSHYGDLNGVDTYIASNISGLWFPLGNDITDDQKEDALSQWNDSWLMTCLKQFYYRTLIVGEFPEYDKAIDSSIMENLTQMRIQRNKKLRPYLDELICQKSQYISLIKRSVDFERIDEEIRTALIDYYKNYRCKKGFSEKTLSSIGYLQGICKDENKGYVLNHVIHCWNSLVDSEGRSLTPMKTIVTESIQECMSTIDSTSSDDDMFVCLKPLKTGIGEPVYFYSDYYNGKLVCHELGDISKIDQILSLKSDTFPSFFLYIKKSWMHNINAIDKGKDGLLKAIGQKIAESIVKELKPYNKRRMNNFLFCKDTDFSQ